jgi:hypothetical protein
VRPRRDKITAIGSNPPRCRDPVHQTHTSKAAILKFPGKRLSTSMLPIIQAEYAGKIVAFFAVPRRTSDFSREFCVWDLALYVEGFRPGCYLPLGQFAWDYDERTIWEHVDDLNAVLGVTWDQVPGNRLQIDRIPEVQALHPGKEIFFCHNRNTLTKNEMYALMILVRGEGWYYLPWYIAWDHNPIEMVRHVADLNGAMGVTFDAAKSWLIELANDCAG